MTNSWQFGANYTSFNTYVTNITIPIHTKYGQYYFRLIYAISEFYITCRTFSMLVTILIGS